MKMGLRKLSLFCALLAYMGISIVQAEIPNVDDQCRILMNSTKATFCQVNKPVAMFSAQLNQAINK